MKSHNTPNNKNINVHGLEAIGTSLKTPYSQKQKENIKTQANSNPFQIKQKQSTINPHLVQYYPKDTAGLNIVGIKLEDAKSTKEINNNRDNHIFNQSRLQDEEYIREAKEFEEKHVVKRITKSGGFKMPQEIIDKQNQRKKMAKSAKASKHPQEKIFDDTRNTAGMSKLSILQTLGITEEDEGVNYDRLQDRIYDNRFDEDLADQVEDQVFDRIDQIHQNREILLQKRSQLIQERENEEKQKQENWDRLTGKERFKAKHVNQKDIEEEQYEETYNLEKEVEEYYTKKLKKQQEDEEDMKKSYKERFFDDKSRFAQKKGVSNKIDENIQKFFQTLNGMEKPTLEETDQTLDMSGKKTKYLRKIWLRQQGIDVSFDSDDLEYEQEYYEHLEEEKYGKSGEKSPGRRFSDRKPRRYDDQSPRRSQDQSPRRFQSDKSPKIHFEKGTYKHTEKSPLNIQSTVSQQVNHHYIIDSQGNKTKFTPQQPIKPPPVDLETREYEKFEKEFQAYRVERKKREQIQQLESSLEKKDFELYQSTSPNRKSWGKKSTANLAKSFNKSKSPDHMGLTGMNKSKEDFHRHQELIMIQQMFDKIDKDQTGQIDKLDAVKYLIQKKQILSIYTLTSQNLNKHVQQFPTSNKGYFTYEEFVQFLKKPRDLFEKGSSSGNYFKDEIKKNLNKSMKKQTHMSQGFIEDEVAELNEDNSTCLLQAEHLRIMKELYNDLDKHNDMIVSRKQYIDKLRSDVRIVKILHLPAVYMPSINKNMNVDRILYLIEQEQFIGDPDTKSTKEYITWTQFLEYFNDIKSLKKDNKAQTQEKIKQIKVLSTLMDNVDDQNELDIEVAMKQILETEYNNQPKKQDEYVNTFSFIEAVKMNNRYPQYCNNLSRRKADKFELKDELFCDTLDRMENEADEYIDFQEIMEFFTRRGRPKYAIKKEEDKDFKEKIATIPRQKDNENQFNAQMRERKEQYILHEAGSSRQSHNNSQYIDKEHIDQIDAYDSDPETHIYSRGFFPDRKSLLRPKSALNRSFQSKSPRGDSKNGTAQGLSQSITKSYVVDKRKKYHSDEDEERQQGRDSGEDAYYSSSQINKKQNKYYHSEEDDFNQRDEDEDIVENISQKHIRIQNVQQNNYVDENQQVQHKQPESKYFDLNRGLHEQRDDYKKAMMDHYADEEQKEKKFKLTKPEPYKFDERERERKKSKTIRQRKVEEMIQEALDKEMKECKTRPIPKEIPDHVKKPLYEKIMHDQEKRRREVRQNSVAITIQREKPFKFYLRDKNPETSMKKSKRKSWKERESFVFKANKVPWFCSINLLEKINRDEELKRQERVAKQAQMTMAMSKLPPRMEKHEQERRARELMEGYGSHSKVQIMNPIKREMFREPTFQPPKAKAIPNFNKMHHEFQERLDKSRQGKRPTDVQPFNFQETRKLPPRDYLDHENELMKQTKTKPVVDKLEEAKKWRDHKPKYQPPSIKKWEQNVERIKKEKEDKDKKSKEEKKKLDEKLKKREEFAVIVREKYSKNDQNIKLEANRKAAVERKKKEFKESEEQYQIKRNEILTKVKNRPLLLEQKCKNRAYLEKLKTLDKIDNRLREKMKSKDRLRMYTKEEIQMLEEIKSLKAKGFRSFRNELEVGDDVSISSPRDDMDDKIGNFFAKDEDFKSDKSKEKLNLDLKPKKFDEQKSFLNTSKDSHLKKEINQDELNKLIETDEDKKQKPTNKLSQNNFQNKPFIKRIDSASEESSFNDKKKEDSIFDKKDSFKQMKDSSFDKKASPKKETPKKDSPLTKATPAPTTAPSSLKPKVEDKKKETTKTTGFEAIQSDEDYNKYDEDFEISD